MDALFAALLVIAIVSPLLAALYALRCYTKHLSAPAPANRIPPGRYLIYLLTLAFVSYWLGAVIGTIVACSSESAGNLCGLWGYFIAGPLCSAATVGLVAKAWSSEGN